MPLLPSSWPHGCKQDLLVRVCIHILSTERALQTGQSGEDPSWLVDDHLLFSLCPYMPFRQGGLWHLGVSKAILAPALDG